jgi:predicted SAM-dependent methyltransferase
MNVTKILKNPKPYVLLGIKRLKNSFLQYYYKGENVCCVICNWKGKRFLDDTCPKCSSVSRTRLIPFALRNFALVGDNLKLLHIAPNRNEYDYVKKNFKHLKGYDRLDIKQRKHTNIQRSMTKTGLDSNSYDLVIIWHVFEHIKEDIKAISEMYRVLKSQGSLLVSVPIYPLGNAITYEDSNIAHADYSKIHGHHDHCRSCGLDYYKRFEALGFKTQTLEVKTLNSKDIVRFGLRTDHVVWCFTK